MGGEDEIDPWVAEWIAANPLRAAPFVDFSPEMLVEEVPDMLANAIAPTPSMAVLRTMVMSARADPATNPRMLPVMIKAVDRSVCIFMEPPCR